MDLAILAAPFWIPAVGFFITYFLGGRRIKPAIFGAMALGLAGGAFFGSAASAMSTADSGSPLLRGSAAGTAAGLITGLVLGGIITMVRKAKA